MQYCQEPIEQRLVLTRDLVESREMWIASWKQCASKQKELIDRIKQER